MNIEAYVSSRFRKIYASVTKHNKL